MSLKEQANKHNAPRNRKQISRDGKPLNRPIVFEENSVIQNEEEHNRNK